MYTNSPLSCSSPPVGRVCVPIDPLECDSFDPFRVPTLRALLNQIDKYDGEHNQEEAKATSGMCIFIYLCIYPSARR